MKVSLLESAKEKASIQAVEQQVVGKEIKIVGIGKREGNETEKRPLFKTQEYLEAVYLELAGLVKNYGNFYIQKSCISK